MNLAEDRVEALFRHDARGRLVEINQWSGGIAPRFFLMRTGAGAIARFRHDLPDDLAARLTELCAGERLSDPPPARPANERGYLELLAAHAPVERSWAGPAFVFSDAPSGRGSDIVAIDETNADLLLGGFEDWLPDIPHRRPFMAVIEAGRAVAICASVRITPDVHCAGVETLPDRRGQGHGSAVVAAWAGAVQALGAAPFYSTSWDNLASQGLARRLGLELVGVDFHAT